ncbi:AfsA-related hotdog domain-containing protein [Streptomyces sp. NPDC050610]|uniref:AfsA-related hotdog domain-containing protein n=1 Tax=Streptomyces sp. NPDC050610 TaxID=3157097 RepID=UPI00342972D9
MQSVVSPTVQAPPPGPSLDPPQELSRERTVPRGLVHRWSLSEVFLTDSRATDGRAFVAAAQLPLSHAYFRDHPGRRAFHDPLLVLEACRQSVTYAAHCHQGVPEATTFMVTSWVLEVTGPAALDCGERPGDLTVHGEVTDRVERGGRLRRLVFAMRLTLDGRPLGTLSMDVSCTPTEQYHALRRMQRGSEVPTAFLLPADPYGEPADAARAGRLDPLNVVLDDARHAAGALESVLSARTFRNRSMYDHPYDHVPAMVFSEAARQGALLLDTDGGADGGTNDGTGAGAGRVLRLHGSFEKFAELDDTVRLTTRPDPERGPGSYVMTAVQSGATVAEVAVTLG